MHKNTERSYLDDLLKRLEKLGYDRPSSIDEFDKPDFILEIGGRKIGVEVTLAVEGEYIRSQKLQDTLYPGEAAIITNLKDGNRRRSNQEIIHDMFDPEQSWKGIDTQMIEWRERIADALQIKRSKFSDFQLFDENWLLIRDPLPFAFDALECKLACQHLACIFSQSSKSGKDFDAVFILAGQHVFRWFHGKLECSP
jgi:subtilisin-like proprotein convertase family protein